MTKIGVQNTVLPWQITPSKGGWGCHWGRYTYCIN